MKDFIIWENPYFLLLLPILFLLVILISHKAKLNFSKKRKLFLQISRLLLFTILILILSKPLILRLKIANSATFIIDTSQSIPESTLESTIKKINEISPLYKNSNFFLTNSDFTHLGNENLILTKLIENRQNFGSQTNLTKVIDFCRSSNPTDTPHFFHLFTDGIETQNNLLTHLQKNNLNNFYINTYSPKINQSENTNDCFVKSFKTSSNKVNIGSNFDLILDLASNEECQVQLTIFESNYQIHNEIITIPTIKKIAFTAKEKKLLNFTAKIEPLNLQNILQKDLIPKNNTASTIVNVIGKPTILYIENENSTTRPLKNAMQSNNIALIQRNSNIINELNLEDLLSYDSIILSDIANSKINQNFSATLSEFVGKHGGSLLFIGGENSFQDNTKEDLSNSNLKNLLPVIINPTSKNENLTASLVLIIDSSSSMNGQKMTITKQASIASSQLLKNNDYIAVIGFNDDSFTAHPLSLANDKKNIIDNINSLDANGGTNLKPALLDALNILNSINTKIKHIIILSDGETQGDGYEALASMMNSRNITISTVAIGDTEGFFLMQAIAKAGGGKYYQTNDLKNITAIFTKDTRTFTKQNIQDKIFTPVQIENHPMLDKLSPFPPLKAYIKTTRRENAQTLLVSENNDPLLAIWNYGLGKVFAFTSDCKNKWASFWINDEAFYSKFWTQVIRELNKNDNSSIKSSINIADEDFKKITVNCSLKDENEFANLSEIPSNKNAKIYSLDDNKKLIKETPLQLVNKNLYYAEFDIKKDGVYLIQTEIGSKIKKDFVQINSQNEISNNFIDQEKLAKIAKIGNGKFFPDNMKTAKIKSSLKNQIKSVPKIKTYHNLKNPLAIAFFIVFLVDILIRRWQNFLSLLNFKS